jgi:hypothetical protein
MSPLKILVVASSGLLTLVGIFDALTNLPVVSGCAFYGECHRESFRDPPGEMGKDVP